MLKVISSIAFVSGVGAANAAPRGFTVEFEIIQESADMVAQAAVAQAADSMSSGLTEMQVASLDTALGKELAKTAAKDDLVIEAAATAKVTEAAATATVTPGIAAAIGGGAAGAVLAVGMATSIAAQG